MTDYGHFIGGKHVAGTSGRKADLFWPMTGEVKGSVALASEAEVRAAVENARAAQIGWADREPAAPRTRVHEVPRPHPSKHGGARDAPGP